MESFGVKKSNHGANVRRWREWRGINQDILAENIGVAQTTLSSYEKRDKLEPEILEKIAKALDIPVEAITEIGQDNAINIISNTFTDFKDNAIANQNYPTFNLIDKVAELYERLLQTEREKVEILQDVLKYKK